MLMIMRIKMKITITIMITILVLVSLGMIMLKTMKMTFIMHACHFHIVVKWVDMLILWWEKITRHDPISKKGQLDLCVGYLPTNKYFSFNIYNIISLFIILWTISKCFWIIQIYYYYNSKQLLFDFNLNLNTLMQKLKIKFIINYKGG